MDMIFDNEILPIFFEAGLFMEKLTAASKTTRFWSYIVLEIISTISAIVLLISGDKTANVVTIVFTIIVEVFSALERTILLDMKLLAGAPSEACPNAVCHPVFVCGYAWCVSVVMIATMAPSGILLCFFFVFTIIGAGVETWVLFIIVLAVFIIDFCLTKMYLSLVSREAREVFLRKGFLQRIPFMGVVIVLKLAVYYTIFLFCFNACAVGLYMRSFELFTPDLFEIIKAERRNKQQAVAQEEQLAQV
eukprot:scaffold26_cov173-Pinguiococcus_pyrenoidosus.AAC.6